MGLTIGAIVLNVDGQDEVAEFWRQALDLDADANPDFLIPKDVPATRLHLDRTDRTHLDLWVDSNSTPEAEVERLIGLGAERVEDWTYPPNADFVVLRAPGGTIFCIIG